MAEFGAGFVELLETHAEITIHDHVVRKRFTLRYRSLGEDPWVPLTLEPGQQLLDCTCSRRAVPDVGIVWLNLSHPFGVRSEVSFETLEVLRPEDGALRVETFTAFFGGVSARLARRTVTARIETTSAVTGVFSTTHPVTIDREGPGSATLRLDVSGEASMGRFRFFYVLENMDPAPRGLPEFGSAAPLPGFTLRQAPEAPCSGFPEREFMEPRRPRPRRRAGLRRLP